MQNIRNDYFSSIVWGGRWQYAKTFFKSEDEGAKMR